jgi:Subtilase family
MKIKILLIISIISVLSFSNCDTKKYKKTIIFKIKNEYKIRKELAETLNLKTNYFNGLDIFFPLTNKITPNDFGEINKINSILNKIKITYLFDNQISVIESLSKKQTYVSCINSSNLYNYFSIETNNELPKIVIDQAIKILNKIKFIEFAEPVFEYENASTGVNYSLSSIPNDNSSRLPLSDTIKGNGIKLIDVEKSWLPNHTEYTIPSSNIIGLISTAAQNKKHGSMVLGILKGTRDIRNFSGIAHDANIFLASENYNIVNAINSAIDISTGPASGPLELGNVILLEMQILTNIYDKSKSKMGKKSNFPLDYSKTINSLLKQADCLNTIIIEAAGNGSVNLDNYFFDSSSSLIKTNALMVGSTNFTTPLPTPPQTQKGNSNYGNIVNTFAWGQNIWTTSYDDTTNSTDGPYNMFENTSASSAIIAGIATYIQSAYKQRYPGEYITPAQMKALLKNNNNPIGTYPYVSPFTMPNLSLSILNPELTKIHLINTSSSGTTINSICR